MRNVQWLAVQREAQLAAEQAARGVTTLGRANHAQLGLYSQAFFDLSIGFERIGKLVFVADHAIENDGAFPSNKALRKLGHKLDRLLARCEIVGSRIDQTRDWATRPTEEVHRAIEGVLTQFAGSLRYYNLDSMTDPDPKQRDPVALWWGTVAAPILERHYRPSQRRKDEAEAATMEELMGGVSFIYHTSETGSSISDLDALYSRARATLVVQKYGRLYTMQIIRWLASILKVVSHCGAYEERIEALLGLDEPFWMFLNEDSYLRDRKTWSIYYR